MDTMLAAENVNTQYSIHSSQMEYWAGLRDPRSMKAISRKWALHGKVTPSPSKEDVFQIPAI